MTSYEDGRRVEWAVVHDLQANGYETTRAASSKGAADVIAANGTTNSRLIRERDAARVELADLRTRLAERDAQVGRLTKRLSEGQG